MFVVVAICGARSFGMAPDSRLSEQPSQRYLPDSLSSSKSLDPFMAHVTSSELPSDNNNSIRVKCWRKTCDLLERSSLKCDLNQESAARVATSNVDRSSFTISTDTASHHDSSFSSQPSSSSVVMTSNQILSTNCHEWSENFEFYNIKGQPSPKHIRSPNHNDNSISVLVGKICQLINVICKYLLLSLCSFINILSFTGTNLSSYINDTLRRSFSFFFLPKRVLESVSGVPVPSSQAKCKSQREYSIPSSENSENAVTPFYVLSNFEQSKKDYIQAQIGHSLHSEFSSEMKMLPTSSSNLPSKPICMAVATIKFYLTCVLCYLSFLMKYCYKKLAGFNTRKWSPRLPASLLLSLLFLQPLKLGKPKRCLKRLPALQLLILLLCLPKGQCISLPYRVTL